MTIGVIGCGYVGIVTSVGLAHIGHTVVGVEAWPERLAALQNDQLPLYEPGLNDLFEGVRATGRLRFTHSIPEAMRECEVLFVCVGTPPRENGEPDLSQVEGVLREMGAGYPESAYRIIVNKSTVPVGSADYVRTWMEEELDSRPGDLDIPEFDVVSNPEFLREGSALQDTFYPDRIVIGSTSDRAFERMRRLYEPLLQRRFDPLPNLRPAPDPPQWIQTDPRSAELIKYAANAFLAMKISFINEMAGISERIGADIGQVAQGIGADHRIGKAFLQSGVGWGGSCFRKDIQALSHLAWEHNCETRLLEATLAVNERQRAKVVQWLQSELKLLKGKTLAVLGVAFKPETDDCRDAPALVVVDRLLDLGARVRAFDPQARFDTPSRSTFRRLPTALEALKGADAAVVMTEWSEIASLTPEAAKGVMRGDLILDARNCLDADTWRQHGFRVVAFGR